MTPDQWEQVDVLFHAALEKKPDERAAFLRQACEGNPTLRQEVDSLLAFYEKKGSFMEDSAFSETMTMLAEQEPQTLAPGQVVGQYTILSLLGRGGMGEVYLARDERLRRNVALKVLRPDAAFQRSAVKRFQLEARAASALNHPNILTVYEVGHSGDVNFIAMEFIEGVTLRERISSSRLDLIEALEITLQAASALVVAHAAGIVHRDIKPENVMIRPDGYVKVLDFGLAKLIERYAAPGSSFTTTSGAVLGTVSYMSPEQVRGLEVDSRTDIWGLGVLLYELITGRLPFEGPTTSDVIVSILEREPSNPAAGPDVPVELGRIILKALAKEPSERHQSVEDLLAELRSVKNGLDLVGRVHQAHENTRLLGKSWLRLRRFGLHQRDRVSWRVLLRPAVLISIAFVGAVAFAAVFWTGAIKRPDQRPRSMSMNALTTTGKIICAAISPDGKYVAYIARSSGTRSLSVRQVGGTGQAKLLSGLYFTALTFSSDSGSVYYVAAETEKGIRMLNRISILGGESTRIIDDVGSPVALSRDGKLIAFERDYQKAGATALIVANRDGTGEREVARRTLPDFYQDTGPAWSPDGNSIATACGTTSKAGARRMTVVEIRLADGAELPVTDRQWRWVGQVAWLKDGDALIMPAAEHETTLVRLLELSHATGEVRPLGGGLASYHYPCSVTAEGSAMVVVQYDTLSSIWTTSASGDVTSARQVTPGIGKYYGVNWASSEDLLYVSAETGNRDIWMMSADGANTRQLTDDPDIDYSPTISPDGSRIVFVSNRTGSFNLWSMDLAGKQLKQLTNGAGEYAPQCSPDGWVLFTSQQPGEAGLWKIPLDGGDPIQLGDADKKFPALSPDGLSLACPYYDDGRPDTDFQVAVFSFKKNLEQPAGVFAVPPESRRLLRWRPNASSLTYAADENAADENDAYNVWSHSLRGGRPKRLTDFESDRILAFGWSVDGKRLACVRGVEVGDVVYVQDFR